MGNTASAERRAKTVFHLDTHVHRQLAEADPEVLTRLWIIEPVPGWLPSRSHLARLTQSPKHQLVDPALSARLLGISEEALLSGNEPATAVPRDGTFLGQLFESLVTLSVRAYA